MALLDASKFRSMFSKYERHLKTVSQAHDRLSTLTSQLVSSLTPAERARLVRQLETQSRNFVTQVRHTGTYRNPIQNTLDDLLSKLARTKGKSEPQLSTRHVELLELFQDRRLERRLRRLRNLHQSAETYGRIADRVAGLLESRHFDTMHEHHEGFETHRKRLNDALRKVPQYSVQRVSRRKRS